MKKISQREARMLRRRVAELVKAREAQLSRWTKDYPGGVHIDSININTTEQAIVDTADKLGFALVAKARNGHIDLFAVKMS